MKFLRQLSIYTLVSFFGAGINFLLMPYLSHFIDPEGYGLLSLLNSLITILIPLVGLVASGLLFVEYYRQKDRADFARLFSSVQLIPVLPGLLFLALALLFPEGASRWLELPEGKAYWLAASVVLAFVNIYYETLLAYVVIEKKPLLFAAFSLGKLLLEVGLTVLFVSGLGWGWEGRMLSWLIVSTVFFVVALVYFRRQGLLTTRVSWPLALSGILYGLPLILHTIGKFVINQSDRVFIAKMVSVEEAGIYNIGYQVGMVVLLLVNAVSNFFQPFLFERLAEPTDAKKREIVKVSYGLLGAILLALLALTAAAPFFFAWLVDERYAGSVPYVFWTGLSYFFWGVYILFSGFIFYLRKTRLLGMLAIVNIVVNVALNFLLIRQFGALGAAYATCISFLLVAVLCILLVRRHFQLPWLLRPSRRTD